ncbi:MAG: protein phosphatase 2C domain-containing protein [Dissulfuribacterales bacterium]
MKTFALTHIGKERKNNEDLYLIRQMPDGFTLLAVADGMGGRAGGEYAARILIEKLSGIRRISENVERQLVALVRDADRSVFEKAVKIPSLEGMGTTVTAALVRKDTVYWVHVGDSRLYILHGSKLVQITKDQNMAALLVSEGKLTEEEADIHPSRNLLEQCVGCGDCKPVTANFEVDKGDLILLTTDGLYSEVSRGILSSIMCSRQDLKSKADSMIHAALKAGGRDNITVVLGEI